MGGGVAIWLTVVSVLAAGTFWVMLDAPLPSDLEPLAAGGLTRVGQLWSIVGLATLLMFMGLVDDRWAIPWPPRLVIQLGAAAGLIAVGFEVTLFWPLNWQPVRWLITVFWVVGLTNAFNFLDNMDGLAGGIGLIATLLFVGAQVAVGSLFVPAVLLILAGALSGFLIHNTAPAALFMGDSGSNFLGFLLGALTVAGTFTVDNPTSNYSRFGVLAPVLVMAVPLYDSASVMAIRLREGRSPFRGDQSHFSHRLVDRGLTRPQAVRTIYLVTLAGGLGALLLHRLEAWGAFVVVAQTLCVLGVVALLERKRPTGNGSSEADVPRNEATDGAPSP